MSETVLYETRGPVAVVTMNRPAVRNAGHIHHPAPAKPILQVRS